MAARVRLTADVDPEVKKRVKLAAVESDQTVSQWIEQVIRDRLQWPEPGAATDTERRYIAPGLSVPPTGSKPRGSKNPPRLQGRGGTISDAVIEDRR